MESAQTLSQYITRSSLSDGQALPGQASLDAKMNVVALILLLWSLTGIASAQLPTGTPACAVPCFIENIPLSPCGTNVTCLCSDTNFEQGLTDCVLKSCIVEDVLITKNATSNVCGLPVKDLVGQYTIVSHILTGLVIGFVMVRVLYKRFLTSIGLGADDWIMLVVAVVCIPCTYLNAKLAEFGIGKDVWTLRPEQITNFGSTLWTITLFYYAEIALLKISILFFLLRIFPNPGFRRITRVTLAVASIYAITFVLLQTFQCWPISYNWTQWNDSQLQGGKCVDTVIIAQTNAAISIAFDIWMLVLPLRKVQELNVGVKKKLAIGTMFVVGTFVTVVSIVRFAFLIQFQNTNNITYDYTKVLLWSTFEIATGGICACLPSLRLILVKMWPKMFGDRSADQHQEKHSNQLDDIQDLDASQVGNNKRASAQSMWKPKFSQRASLGFSVEKPLGTTSIVLERIDSTDEMRLDPSNSPDPLSSMSATTGSLESSHEGLEMQIITADDEVGKAL